MEFYNLDSIKNTKNNKIFYIVAKRGSGKERSVLSKDSQIILIGEKKK